MERPDAAPAEPLVAPEIEAVVRQLIPRPATLRLLDTTLYKLTPAGRSLVLLAVGAAVVGGSLGIAYPLYQLAIALVAFLTLAQLGGILAMPGFAREEARRLLPERCATNAVIEGTVELEHRGWWPALEVTAYERLVSADLRLVAMAPYVDVVRPGERVSLTYQLQPLQRGSYDLKGPYVGTAYPFGIFHTTRGFQAPHRLLVYPSFQPLERLDLPAGRRHQPGGLALVSQVGDSEEFIGLREYRPGDRLRDLHHQAWARLGTPVVREYSQEYLTRVALVVDTFVPPRRGGARPGSKAMEAAISLGAAVADALSRLEYVVDLFAAGPELYHFQAGRSLAYLDDILDVLACIEPCTADPFPRLGPALLDDLGQLSTAVVILLDWDESRLRFVDEIRSRGVEVKLIFVRQGALTMDPGLGDAPAAPKQFTPAQVEEGVRVL